MHDSRIASYGSWKSPITSDLIVSGAIGLSQPLMDGSDLYWVEMRPTEGGRSVIVKRDASAAVTEVNPQPFNARTRVHEYGGGDYTVRDTEVYFSNFSDQRLYAAIAGGLPQPITPLADMRYADAVIDKARGRLLCVREDHTASGREAVNTLASLSLAGDGNAGQVLASGNDFYSSPRLSPDGSKLAWLTWNHPNMPWDGTELWVGTFAENGLLAISERVAGGNQESLFQPEWSPDGVLYFVSDRNGWWNLYRVDQGGTAESMREMKAEFGMPQWAFGMSTYAFESAERIVCAYIENGISRLALIDTRTKEFEPIDSPYTDIRFVRASRGLAVMRAGSPSEAASIVRFDLEKR